MVREKSGKNKNFSRSGKSQRILQMVRENLRSCKASEKSGNFVFSLPQGFVKIMKTFLFRKVCCSRSIVASYAFRCSVFGQWISL